VFMGHPDKAGDDDLGPVLITLAAEHDA
jgi:hypothetical protein